MLEMYKANRDAAAAAAEKQFPKDEVNFASGFRAIAERIHRNAVDKGFYEEGVHESNKAQMLCLVHSEISEALEKLRNPEMRDKHIPHLSPVGLELADAIIRIMDMSYAFKYDIGACILAKMKYNETREYKHGKQF